MNGKTTIPTKTWKEEYTKLTAERKTLNQRYLALKEEANLDLSVCIGENYTRPNYEKQSPFYVRSDYPDRQYIELLRVTIRELFRTIMRKS